MGDLPNALFMIGALLVLLVVYRVDKSEENTYNFTDNLMTNGKADVFKLVYLSACAMLIWVLFRLAYDGNLTEWFVTAFIGGVVIGSLGNRGIKAGESIFGKRQPWTEEERKEFEKKKNNGSPPTETT